MDLGFVFNRYLRNRRIVNGYKYQFEPYGGGAVTESYFDKAIFRDGDTFIDIGANSGGWAIPASKYYKRVIAFEANPTVARVLHKNVRLNKLMNVWVMPFAVGEEETEKMLYLYPKTGQDSFLKEHMGVSSWGPAVKVTMVTLDGFKYPYKPDVMKIDTEGWELNVLKGAVKTIRNNHPRLAIETHDPRDVILIEKMLDSYKFEKIKRESATAEPQTIMIGEPVGN